MSGVLRFDQLDASRQSGIRANIAKMEQAGASDDQITDYLVNGEHLAPLGGAASSSSPPTTTIHAQYASGQLARRMAAENAEDAAESGGGVGTQVLGTLASLARDIPGVDALQAGASALVNGIPYAQARQQIHDAEDAAVLDTPARLAGAAVAAGAIPQAATRLSGIASRLPVAGERVAKVLAALANRGSLQAATYGAAQALGQSDPNAGLATRLKDAGANAATGYVVGGLGDRIANAVMASNAPNAAQNIADRITTRDATAAREYAQARAEGVGRTNTPAIQAQLAEPDNAAIVNALLQQRQFRGLNDTDPRVLDALYKARSDEAGQLQRGLSMPTPNQPNTGRFAQQDVRQAQGDLLDAYSGGTSLPGPMPTYRTAVQNYAKASDAIDALRYGEDMTRSALGQAVTTGKNLDRTTAPAFTNWLSSAAPDEINAAQQGVLGATRGTGDKVVPGLMLNPRQLRPFAGAGARSQAAAVGGLLRQTLAQPAAETPSGYTTTSILRSLLNSQGYPFR